MRISTRALHAQHARLLSHPRGRFCFRVTPHASPHSMWNLLAPLLLFRPPLCIHRAALSNPRLRCVPRLPLIALLGTWHNRSVSMLALIWSQSRTHAPLVVCLDHDLFARKLPPPSTLLKRDARWTPRSPWNPRSRYAPVRGPCACAIRQTLGTPILFEGRGMRPSAGPASAQFANPGNSNSFRACNFHPIRMEFAGGRIIRNSFRFIVRGRDFI